jgi:hypothetical protein
VSFDLTVPNLKNHPDISRIVPDVTQQLSQVLARRFRYWNFSPAQGAAFPRLAIGLKMGSNMEMTMKFFADRADNVGLPRDVPWRSEVYASGELDLLGIPARDVFRDVLVRKFEEGMLGSNGEAIQNVLKRFVALGSEVAPVQGSGPPMAVLGLKKDVYADLVYSEFNIHYLRAGEPIAICSEGTGYRDFPSPPAPSPFEAIQVTHRKWKTDAANCAGEPITDHLGELDSLRPFVFFLNKVVPVTFHQGLPIRVVE